MSGSRVARWARELLYQPAIYTAILLFGLAALIAWRRTAGAICEPLPAIGFMVAGAVLSLMAGVAHWSGRLFAAQRDVRWFSDVTLTLSLFALAATLTLPGTSTLSLCLFWVLLLLEEVLSWRIHFFPIVNRPNEATQVRQGEAPAELRSCEGIARHDAVRQAPRAQLDNFLPASPIEAQDAEIDDPLLPEEVTQQLTRSMAADGTDELAGWLRIPFVAGRRTTSVHLAFCPPFAHTPELQVEQIDGPEARIKAVQVLPYGARLDLKLHADSKTPTAVILHFSARSDGEG